MSDSKREQDMQVGGNIPAGNNLTSAAAAKSQGVDVGQHCAPDPELSPLQRRILAPDSGVDMRAHIDPVTGLLPPSAVEPDPYLFGPDTWPTPEELEARRSAGAIAASAAIREYELALEAADMRDWPLLDNASARAKYFADIHARDNPRLPAPQLRWWDRYGPYMLVGYGIAASVAVWALLKILW